MQSVIINLYLFVVVWFILFYFWYLTWPKVAGKVTNIDSGISKGIGINRPRKFHLINYTYEYNGNKYQSRRQGLIIARAFAPKVEVGDIIQVRVCRLFQSLSCPSRVWFEAKVILFSVLALTVMALIIYVLPPL